MQFLKQEIGTDWDITAEVGDEARSFKSSVSYENNQLVVTVTEGVVKNGAHYYVDGDSYKLIGKSNCKLIK